MIKYWTAVSFWQLCHWHLHARGHIWHFLCLPGKENLSLLLMEHNPSCSEYFDDVKCNLIAKYCYKIEKFPVPTALENANSDTTHLSNVNHTHISQLILSTWVEICQIRQGSNLLLHLLYLFCINSPITATLSRQNRIKISTASLFFVNSKWRTLYKLWIFEWHRSDVSALKYNRRWQK